MRITLYARVSKADQSQDPENQLQQLRHYARALGGKVVKEYVDFESGGSSQRESFWDMLDDADNGKFDEILVWALDRFSREGILNMSAYIQRLKESGVNLRSLREPWLSIADDGAGEVLLMFMSWMAAQEKKRIGERTRAGLEKARKQGRYPGRPRGSKDDPQKTRVRRWRRKPPERVLRVTFTNKTSNGKKT